MQRIGYCYVGPILLGLDIHDEFQRMMLFGTYEESTKQIIQAWLRPGGTYIDIGTQLGYTAGLAAQVIGKNGTMVLFEPDPTALQRLKKHLAASKQSQMPKTILIESACSNQKGELHFEVATTLGHSRILANKEELRDGQLISVPLEIADEVFENLKIERIDFLKIDVEGHEKAVLAGLQKSLKSGVIEAILIEKNLYLFEVPDEDVAILHALVARHGYIGFHEEMRILITPESLRDPSIMLENFFFVKDLTPVREMFSFAPQQEKTNLFNQQVLDELAISSISPSDRDLELRRLIKLVRSNQLNRAISEAEIYLEHQSDFCTLRGHIAHWYLAIQNQEKAASHLQTLLEFQPQNQDAQVKLHHLKNRTGSIHRI
ncbi:MAG: FkbM family methyltransferase [Sumerlaeia bacterium]